MNPQATVRTVGLMSTLSNNITKHNFVSYKYKYTYTDNKKVKHNTIHINYGSSFKSKYEKFAYCTIPIQPSEDILGTSLSCESPAIKIFNQNKAYYINQTVTFSLMETSKMVVNENILHLFEQTMFKGSGCYSQRKENKTKSKIICEKEAQIHLFPSIGFMFNKFVVRIMKHKGSLNTLTLIMERKMSLLFTSQMMTLLMK